MAQPWVGLSWVGFVVAASMALDLRGPLGTGRRAGSAAGLYVAVGWRSRVVSAYDR